jgi:predicted RNA-binding protein with PIN domain
MARELLIDGYNLLHAAGLARRRYGPGDLERCRRDLLRLIAGQLSDEQRRRTTVVFDAKDPPPDAGRHGTHAEILVLYATEDEEADDLIEQIIAGHSAPRQLIVVSSDHRLHKAARRRKANPIDSDAFLDDCARRVYCRRTPRPEPEHKPDCDASPAAVAEWLSVFDIDVLDMSQQVSRAPVLPTPPSPAAPSGPKQKPERKPASRKPAAKNRRSPQNRPREPLDDLAFWEARIADLFRRHPEEFGEDR